MVLLDLIDNENQLFVEDVDNLRVKTLTSRTNALLNELKDKYVDVIDFLQSEKNGEYVDKAIIALSLAEFFKGNRFLKLDQVVDNIRSEELSLINSFYFTKTKLLDALNSLFKLSNKESILFRCFLDKNEFHLCSKDKTITITKNENNDIIPTLINIVDKEMVVEGIFDTLKAQEVTFDTTVLDKNVALCNQKNIEINKDNFSKFQKTKKIIAKLNEMGKRVVSFYTYKNALFLIGCNIKGIQNYENVLSHNYVPLKNALKKQLDVELKDICAVQVNEDLFSIADENFDIDISHVDNDD